MRVPWIKAKQVQLDLLSTAPAVKPDVVAVVASESAKSKAIGVLSGLPLMLAASNLFEDPNNPRTEFPEADLDELADDIGRHGILQPLVVHPADSEGRYRIHFGAKRLRAATQAGLHEVPVVVRNMPADPYAQVAENRKRHGLTPLEIAKFIRAQADAGDSNATIAKQLGMNPTTVAHHLALLDLPPELDEALKSGRCTSPRTLHELSKLQQARPEEVQQLLTSGSEITRTAVSAVRALPTEISPTNPTGSSRDKRVVEANAACDRLERALGRITPPNSYQVALPELIALRIRVEDITKHWLQGSDGQAPLQTGH